MNPHTPKWTPIVGVGVTNGFPNFQNTIVRAKTHQFEKFFISSENYWNLDVYNELASPIWTSETQVMIIIKSRESNWQFDFWPLKVRNWPDFLVCKRHVTYRWKAFDKGYNFVLDLIIIGGLHAKLWAPKITGVQVVGISGLPTWESWDKKPFGFV
jgi:hypothetical protein